MAKRKIIDRPKIKFKQIKEVNTPVKKDKPRKRERINYDPTTIKRTDEGVFYYVKANKKKDKINFHDLMASQDFILSYLIFGFERLKKYYDLETEQILLLLYLYDLKVFKMTINILGVSYSLGFLIADGYIDKYDDENELYQLSKMGLGVVSKFVKILNEKVKFIEYNREYAVTSDDAFDLLFEKAMSKNKQEEE